MRIPEYPEEAAFEVCSYLESEKCKRCPRDIKDARYGTVHPACRLLADETIKKVLIAVNKPISLMGSATRGEET